MRVTFSDRKKSTGSGNAKVLSYANYYPFGSLQPGRSYQDFSGEGAGSGYRFGFNGKESTPEVHNQSGAVYDYGFRIYDSRLARFMSEDPLAPKFPMLSPYAYAANRPVDAIDLDGLEPFKKPIGKPYKGHIPLSPGPARRKYEQGNTNIYQCNVCAGYTFFEQKPVIRKVTESVTLKKSEGDVNIGKTLKTIDLSTEKFKEQVGRLIGDKIDKASDDGTNLVKLEIEIERNSAIKDNQNETFSLRKQRSDVLKHAKKVARDRGFNNLKVTFKIKSGDQSAFHKKVAEKREEEKREERKTEKIDPVTGEKDRTIVISFDSKEKEPAKVKITSTYEEFK